MRTIKRPVAFRKDYKRVKSNPKHAQNVEKLLVAALALLATDQSLPDTYRDHALVGQGKSVLISQHLEIIWYNKIRAALMI